MEMIGFQQLQVGENPRVNKYPCKKCPGLPFRLNT